jgi:hypothetical protein
VGGRPRVHAGVALLAVGLAVLALLIPYVAVKLIVLAALAACLVGAVLVR